MTEVDNSTTPILRLTDGLWFSGGPITWSIPSLKLYAGQWAALVPGGDDPVVDPSGSVAKILASLSRPKRGTVEINGDDIYRLSYRDLQRLRGRLGYVQGYGGLLSNRTIRENITLPASIHGKMSLEVEEEHVQRFLDGFSLAQVSELRPHELDGYTRWRTCVARAMVLSPDSLVLEGIGDWELDRGRSVAWSRLTEFNKSGKNVVTICLSRKNPEFEAWFEQEGGILVRYDRKQSENQKGAVSG